MSQKRRTAFRVSVDGEPVTEIETPRLKNSINVRSAPHVPGCVSLYEEHLTRREAGYLLPQWYALSQQERALEIALRRVVSKIEALNAEKMSSKT